ncbi:MAG: protein-methionine-sulfoxide reductase catalytic subunit MsrP [Acetobacteraceae bacterium]|nr:protein-methionine-sulfoxide reductase catalytic subunit MsrP [Acetobacteraceae bacterium]
MNIIHRKGWELPASQVTPESVALNRRTLLGAGAASILAPGLVHTAWAEANVVTRSSVYEAGRQMTEEKEATTFNNYYEFGASKNIWRAARALPMQPWKIKLDGLIKGPREIDFDALVKAVSLEERIYRHRCVEAWAMTVPWVGFPLAQLVKLAEPLVAAKYVVFTTATDKSMPGLKQDWYPWPYTEGVTIEEAANDLAFLATGLYGKPMPPQNGGPIRLVVPWKYGFKGAKSIVRISFTAERPRTFWETIQGQEYGFWANVNPEVPHPRWSQASERLLGSDERVPTRIYNGYGEFVAGLYSGLAKERLFI